MKVLTVMSAFLMTWVPCAVNAEEYVVQVFLSASGGTITTDRFIYEFKEVIRRSSTITLADNKDDVFQVASLVAQDIGKELLAYSFVRNWMIDGNEIFVTHYVGTCGEEFFQKCARDLLSVLATGVDKDRSDVLKLMKKDKVIEQKPPVKKSL